MLRIRGWPAYSQGMDASLRPAVLVLLMTINGTEFVERAEGPVPLSEAQRIAQERNAAEAEDGDDDEISFRWSVAPYSPLYADATPLA